MAYYFEHDIVNSSRMELVRMDFVVRRLEAVSLINQENIFSC